MNTKNKLTLALKALLLIACFNVFIHHLALAQTPPFSFTFEKIVETGDQLPGISLDTFLDGTPSFSKPSLNGTDLTFVGYKNEVHGVKAIYSARANSFNLLEDTNTLFPEEAGVGFRDFKSVSASASITDNDSDGIPDAFDSDPDAIADGSCTEIDGVVGIAFVTYTESEHCSAPNWISTGLNVIVDTTSEVIYEAGDSIHLFPGFQVKKGGLFSAFISEDSNPEIDPPLISAFAPNSGPVGTLVTLSGNNFAPSLGLVPEVLMRKQGGGTQRVPIAGYDNRQIRITVPTGTDSGSIKIQVGALSSTTAQNFTVQTSSDYQLQAEPATAQLIQGHSIVYSIELSSNNGFKQLAILQINGLPAGMLAEFTPSQIAAGQKATLTLTAAPGQTLGSHNFTVTADAEIDGFSVTQTVNLSTQVIAETTSFMGQAVQADPQQTPLAGVSIHFLGRDGNGNPTECNAQTTSDAAGNFVFTNLPPECTGDQLIRYDGLSVTNLSGDYAGVDLYYNIADGIVTESPVLVHLPRIDDKETVMVKQNWPEDQHFAFTSIPNLEATVYAGTILTLVDGSQPDPFPLTAIDVPVDRLPEEMPLSDSEVMPFIVAFQPANAEASQPVAVTFPNLLNAAPGTNMDLSTLDPTKGVMVLYGTGTVSDDGSKIIPDLDPAFPGHRYGLVHFDWHGWLARIIDLLTNLLNPGPLGNGTCLIGSNSIDPSSGLEILRKTDLVINSPRGGISIQRNYRTLSNIQGPFGIGANHNYGYRLDTNTPQTTRIINLVVPEGNRYPFITSFGSANLRNLIIPAIRGAEMSIATNGEVDIRWKNGTIFHFVPSTVINASELESITDANGNKTLLIRNPAVPAQISEVVGPTGLKLKLNYDGANRITTITDPIGRRVSYTYNAQGTLETVTNPEGGITRYDYDAANRLTQVTDARGVIVAKNIYDANGRAVEQVQSDGGSWLFEYTLLNPLIPASPIQQTIVTDPRGNSTTYRFNPQAFLIGVTDVREQPLVIARVAGSNLKRSIKAEAVCDVCGTSNTGDQSFTYDDNGNLLTTTDARDNTSLFEYEPVNNKITAATDPLNQQVQLTYDNKGNLITFTDQNGETSTLSYQPFGLLSEIEDPLNERTTLGYDAVSNLSTITDSLGNVSHIQYDAVNRPIGTTDALGHQSLLTYDNLNRVLNSINGLGQATTFTYDEVGNLLTLTDAKNQTTTFSYDAMNRLATRKDPLGQIETFNYDLNGNLISMTDRRGQLSQFSYDNLNQLITETYADGAIVQRSYDQRGRLIRVDDSSGGIFTFTYDALGQLTSETTPFGKVEYTYDARGQMLTRLVVGQSRVDYDYDPAGNLLSTAMPQASATMTYDERNLLTKITRSNGVTTDHSYDTLGRLKSIIHANGTTAIDTQNYDYDALGNRVGHSTELAKPFITQPAISTFDDNNRLLTRNGTSYTYDGNGNRVTETDVNGIKTYAWDARDRLISIVTPTDTITFRFDFAGNLIQQTTSDVNGVSTQNFLLDDLTNVVHESRSNGDEFSNLTGRTIDSHLAVSNSNNTTEFGLSDGLNSTVVTVNQAGSQTSTLNYEPFGKRATGSEYPFKYTGRVPASENLYHYRARFYDSEAGRFISEDPIGFLGGGVNLYSYVANNPLNFLDPSGLYLREILIAGAIGIQIVSFNFDSNTAISFFTEIPSVISTLANRKKNTAKAFKFTFKPSARVVTPPANPVKIIPAAQKVGFSVLRAISIGLTALSIIDALATDLGETPEELLELDRLYSESASNNACLAR